MEQPGVDGEIIEAFVGIVDSAAHGEIDGGAVERGVDRGLAVGDLRAGIDGELRGEQPRRQPGNDGAGGGGAAGGEQSLGAGDGDGGDGLAGVAGIEAAGPGRPAAIAGQPGIERRRQPEQVDDGAAGRGGDERIDIELVGIGVGIEVKADGVAAALGGFPKRQDGEIDERAPLLDGRIAADAENTALARHRRFEHQPVDAEAADDEIEIGEKGQAAGGQQLRPAQHPHFGGGDALGGEGLGDEVERAPIEVEAGDFGKDALGV